jgi:hypothetical protein
MASQKVANCFVAANYLVTAADPSTPHSSKLTRLAFDDFCLAIAEMAFNEIINITSATHRRAAFRDTSFPSTGLD